MNLWITNVWNAYVTTLLRICVRSITGSTPLKLRAGYSSWIRIDPNESACGLSSLALD